MRQLTARIAALIIRRNGYRFSKDFRHGTTLRHRLIYRCIDTVSANLMADGYRGLL